MIRWPVLGVHMLAEEKPSERRLTEEPPPFVLNGGVACTQRGGGGDGISDSLARKPKETIRRIALALSYCINCIDIGATEPVGRARH